MFGIWSALDRWLFKEPLSEYKKNIWIIALDDQKSVKLSIISHTFIMILSLYEYEYTFGRNLKQFFLFSPSNIC